MRARSSVVTFRSPGYVATLLLFHSFVLPGVSRLDLELVVWRLRLPGTRDRDSSIATERMQRPLIEG
jgi:hypothetical protein